MLALKGLLFSLFTLALTTVVSLLVVGIIKLIYRIVRRSEASKTAGK